MSVPVFYSLKLRLFEQAFSITRLLLHVKRHGTIILGKHYTQITLDEPRLGDGCRKEGIHSINKLKNQLNANSKHQTL